MTFDETIRLNWHPIYYHPICRYVFPTNTGAQGYFGLGTGRDARGRVPVFAILTAFLM